MKGTSEKPPSRAKGTFFPLTAKRNGKKLPPSASGFSELPKNNAFDVVLLTKIDNVRSDEGGRIARALGVDTFASLHQVHGNTTIIIRGPCDRTEKADGMITDTKGLALIVRTADCQTFAVYAPKAHVCGVLHIGWRGLIAGAIERFFLTLQESFGVQPKDTFVTAGPSLCTACAEFTDPKAELPNIGAEFIHGRCVDLRGASDAKLDVLGVRPEYLERDPRCTRCNREMFWTYRGGDLVRVTQGYTNVLACCLR